MGRYQCSNPEHHQIVNELLQRAGWDEEKFERLLKDERIKRGYLAEED